jgi:hypothetical protein
VVIDTNRLQSDELWAFLAMSPDNIAVLPDYVAMESFKPASLEGLRTQFAILSRFPDQVLILKGTGEVSQLNPDAVDMADAMIDREHSSDFKTFCRLLPLAERSLAVRAQLEERAGWAQGHMEVMLKGLEALGAAMDEFRAPFTATELAAIRRDEPFTQDMARKFHDLADAMANGVFEQMPDLVRPSTENRHDHFIVRYALGYAAYMVSRIRAGAIRRNAAAERNDTIDVLLAVYGTYFDGVMSDDTLTNEVHHVARAILQEQGAALGRPYVPGFMMQVVEYLEAHAEEAPGAAGIADAPAQLSPPRA